MTSKEIQDINRVIAEAMGWTNIQYVSAKTVKGLLGYPPGEKKEITFGNITIPQKIPNPIDSISDAMEAVIYLCKKKIIIGFSLFTESVEKYSSAVWGGDKIKFHFSAKTPAAALSLALAEYLKEMK